MNLLVPSRQPAPETREAGADELDPVCWWCHRLKYSITKVTSGQKIKRNPTTQQNEMRTCAAACVSTRSIHRGRKQAQKQMREHTAIQENIRSRKMNRTTRTDWSDCCERSGSKLTRSHQQPAPRRRQPRKRTPRSFALLSKSKRLPDSAMNVGSHEKLAPIKTLGCPRSSLSGRAPR